MAQTRQHADSIAEARQAIVARWVDERKRDLESLTSLPVVMTLLERILATRDESAADELKGILDTIQSQGNIYEHLAVYDAAWKPVAISEEQEHADRSSFASEFQTQAGGNSGVVFGPVHRHEDGDVGVHMCAPIRRSNGETLGHLAGNLDLTASLEPLLKDPIGLWSMGAVYIVDAASQLIVGEERGGAGEMDMSSLNEETGVRSDSTGESSTSSLHGERTITASRALPLGDLRLVVQFDTEESMAAVQVLLYRTIGTVSAALVAVTIVSIWISRLIGAPLANLAAVARRISDGQFNERMEPMRLREAEDVREAFNQMLDQLRDKESVIVRSAKLAIVGELTSRVVHEMRNPLSSIKMNLQAIRRSMALNAGDLELAEIAEVEIQRLDRMLNELLLYGRPVELRLEPFQATRIFELVPLDLLRMAADKGVASNMEVEDGLASRCLSIDVEQFSRVLANLVKNSIEASVDGSTVLLSVRRSECRESEVVIEVRDHGSGIRPEHADLVFRPFFTTKSGGTGLGLANVQKIVELHAGRVRVVSHWDGGTSFLVEMPCPVNSAALDGGRASNIGHELC